MRGAARTLWSAATLSAMCAAALPVVLMMDRARGSKPSDGPSEERAERAHRARHFYLPAHDGASLDHEEEVAEDTLALVCEWLQIDVAEFGKLPVYFCRSIDELETLEQELGLPRPAVPRPPELLGGYYPRVPTIAVVVAPKHRAAAISHEVVHWAISRVTPRCPRVIDEGLAEYLSYRLLARRADCREAVVDALGRRTRSLARIVDAGPLPSLRGMFQMGFWEFQNASCYYLSWCMGDVLCELEAQGEGTLRRLLEGFASSEDPWAVFDSLYVADRVERLWWGVIRNAADAE